MRSRSSGSPGCKRPRLKSTNFPSGIATLPVMWASRGPFSAGDLMMVSVLLSLKASGMLDEYPNLCAYVARGEARPAFRRAFDTQLAGFTAASTR